jgi:hypothetical protein
MPPHHTLDRSESAACTAGAHDWDISEAGIVALEIASLQEAVARNVTITPFPGSADDRYCLHIESNEDVNTMKRPAP